MGAYGHLRGPKGPKGVIGHKRPYGVPKGYLRRSMGAYGGLRGPKEP